MVRAFESPNPDAEREWVTGPLHLAPSGDEEIGAEKIVGEKKPDDDVDDDEEMDGDADDLDDDEFDDLDDDLVDLDDEYDDFDDHEHGSGGGKRDE